ncbi:hypothetical protein TNCV_3420781 [Trichonephila clavipes]|nr:hypothetical protein TNCV_3420781 [Trichonephila clavipes]
MILLRMSQKRDEAPIAAKDPGPFGPCLKTSLGRRHVLARGPHRGNGEYRSLVGIPPAMKEPTKKPSREPSRLNRKLLRRAKSIVSTYIDKYTAMTSKTKSFGKPWEALATVGPIPRHLERAEAIVRFRLTTGHYFLGVQWVIG